ncbi:MAG TPA: glycosyltransferase, partial [Acetobacteraceae bacterium]|nr:glycosyltransferase [Acetobacteraceae bacterium]
YLLEQPQRVRNLFSYDGYLTISDSLVRFVRDFCYGVGRSEEPGFFYLTPQASELRTDWQTVVKGDALRVVYFGTNWNRRTPLLFRALERTGILAIHGPEESWREEGYASYRGPIPFDGVSPQRIYAECGLGLALMDERWRREDVISNRVFEIASVGAVAICPDMPWTRKWFGDAVLYYEADRSAQEIAEKIRAHHDFVRANPERAQAMGEEARQIFEAHFAAERMLANAIAYHERKTAERRQRRAEMEPAPRISVVLRCGGRDPGVVRRAVDSIRRQTFGSFTVILAKFRPVDLSEITADTSGAIAEFVEFLIPGGSRAEMLFAALDRVKTPYFAVLDDDDFWMSDHFEELFRAGRRVREDFDMAFSGSIGFDYPILYNATQSCSRNILRFGYEGPIADALDVQIAIGTNCFVARTDLIQKAMRAVPQMRTAEDSLLVCLLAWRSRPIFSYRPTAFYRRDAEDGSRWQIDAQRTEDEISLALRAGLAWQPDWLPSGSFAVLTRMWADAWNKLGPSFTGEVLDRLFVGAAGQRTPRGIATRPGETGHICYGPYVRLPAGHYSLTFLIAPGEAVPEGGEPVGEVDIAADIHQRLAWHPIGAEDQEVTLHFTIDHALESARIEFRVATNGRRPFTVASGMLTHDEAEAGTAAMPPEPPGRGADADGGGAALAS